MKPRKEPTPQEQAEPLPSLRPQDYSPHLVELQNKRKELLARDDALVAEHNDLFARLARGESGESKLNRAAALMLDGKDHHLADEHKTGGARLNEIDEERLVLRRALLHLDSEILKETRAASLLVAEKIQPEFLRRAGAVAAALANLVAVNEEFEALADAMHSAGVFGTKLIAHAVTHMTGRAATHQSTAANWFREAVRLGLVSRDDVPEWVRLPKERSAQ